MNFASFFPFRPRLLRRSGSRTHAPSPTAQPARTLSPWENLFGPFIVVTLVHGSIVSLAGSIAGEVALAKRLVVFWAGISVVACLILVWADRAARHLSTLSLMPPVAMAFLFALEVPALCTLTHHDLLAYLRGAQNNAFGPIMATLTVSGLGCAAAIGLCCGVSSRATTPIPGQEEGIELQAPAGNEKPTLFLMASKLDSMSDRGLQDLEEGKLQVGDVDEGKLIPI